jgi:SAM-dependent methyltransferase
MRHGLVERLGCPDCLIRLEPRALVEERGEILAGALRCPGCGNEYPIRDGIPRFVRDQGYVASFGFEWSRWRRTQFDTASRRTSESTFVGSTGRRPADLHGQVVLDAGCGAGRYMDLAARAGAETIGVDLSSAIDVARENLGHRPNCSFVQADLLHAPFLPHTFDFIYSIGVLHHTPDTRRACLRLFETLKPGGEMAIWVYPRRRLAETFERFPDRVNEVLALDVQYRIPPRWQGLVRRLARALDWTTEASSSLQRGVTSRLPPRLLFWLCHAAIPLYYLYRIPVFYPLRLLTKIAMDPNPEWRVLDTFDWYSPRYQWKHTYAEVRGWFEDAGAREVAILPRPVAVRARKPASIPGIGRGRP